MADELALIFCVLAVTHPTTPGLSSLAKMGTPTNATCTTRRHCTCCAWAPASCWKRLPSTPASPGPMRTSAAGPSACRSSSSGPAPSWTTASTRVRTWTPRTTRKTARYTTLLPPAWRHAWRWDMKEKNSNTTPPSCPDPQRQSWHESTTWYTESWQFIVWGFRAWMGIGI